MPVLSSEILLKYSVKVGSAGNTNAGNAAGSLGRYISTTVILDGTVNNLFDDIAGIENATSEAEYRCAFVHNANASLTLTDVIVWISSEIAGGANVALSVDTTSASPIGSSSAQAKDIANENIAPLNQVFSSPTSKATGLALGNLPAGQCIGIWFRRTATNSAAIFSDGATITIEGDTAA